MHRVVAFRYCLLLTWICLTTNIAAQAPPLRGILARAGAYVARYERELGALIAEEWYVQESGPVTGGFSNVPAPGRMGAGTVAPPAPETKATKSEFLMLPIPGSQNWAGFRDVFEVGGRRIRDGAQRFDASFFQKSEADALAYWKRLNEESGRHNIGPIARTINVPPSGCSFFVPTTSRGSGFA